MLKKQVSLNILKSMSTYGGHTAVVGEIRQYGKQKKQKQQDGTWKVVRENHKKFRGAASVTMFLDKEPLVVKENYSKYPAEQYQALASYRGDDYTQINYVLRNNSISYDDFKSQKGKDDSVVKKVSAIDEAFNHPYSELKHDLVLHRGIDLNTNHPLFGLEPGDEFIDSGFISTTLDEEVAHGFSVGDHKLRIEIYAKKGQKAISMIDEDEVEEMASEFEYLLPRNTKFKVLKNQSGYMELAIV